MAEQIAAEMLISAPSKHIGIKDSEPRPDSPVSTRFSQLLRTVQYILSWALV